jgi:hypothetical protein
VSQPRVDVLEPLRDRGQSSLGLLVNHPRQPASLRVTRRHQAPRRCLELMDPRRDLPVQAGVAERHPRRRGRRALERGVGERDRIVHERRHLRSVLEDQRGRPTRVAGIRQHDRAAGLVDVAVRDAVGDCERRVAHGASDLVGQRRGAMEPPEVEHQVRDHAARPASDQHVGDEADGRQHDRGLVGRERAVVTGSGRAGERPRAQDTADERCRGKRGRRGPPLDAPAARPPHPGRPDHRGAQRGRDDGRPAERLDRPRQVCSGDDGSPHPAGDPRVRIGEQQVDERAAVQEHECVDGAAGQPGGAGRHDQQPGGAGRGARRRQPTGRQEDRPGAEIGERRGLHDAQPSRPASAAPVRSPLWMKPSAGLAATRRRYPAARPDTRIVTPL